MEKRALDEEEIRVLRTVSSQQADASLQRRAWPGHENLKALAQAVKERQPFVMFGDTRFSIRYYTQFGNGTVFVKPDMGPLNPCGYFSIDKLENPLEVMDESIQD